MIEKTVLDYLNENLDVNAYMEIPENIETSFVLIEKTSGSRTNEINNAMIAIQSYGATLYEAAQLNETVKELMYKLPETEDVGRCHLNTDYNFTDSQTKRYRYQSVWEIYY